MGWTCQKIQNNICGYIKENEVDNFNSRDYNNNHWKITLLYKGGNRNGTDF